VIEMFLAIIERIGELVTSMAASTAVWLVIGTIIAVAAGPLPDRLKAWTISRGNRHRLHILIARLGQQGNPPGWRRAIKLLEDDLSWGS
jgi:hypothetical protein